MLKIQLLPTKNQTKIFEEWGNTTRYVYNKCLDKVKKDITLLHKENRPNFMKDCITIKDNNIVKEGEEHNFDKFLYDWEIRTPKEIRYGALRDIEKAYKTAWANLKAGNIKSFGLGFRKKKDYEHQSMEIEHRSIRVNRTNNKVSLNIFPRIIKSKIKIHRKDMRIMLGTDINHTCRLKKENNMWYLCIPVVKEAERYNVKQKTCALDPGIRKFQTIYSETTVISIEPNKAKIKKLYNRLDLLQKLRDEKKIKKTNYSKKRCKVQARLTNLIDDMHYKTISFLTHKFTDILLPSFESQDMVRSKKLHSKTKRDMMNYKFYKFQQRLVHKCKLLKHCNVHIVNEAYTSQTCGFCGHLNKTSDEIINCGNCKKIYDRDVNGARNIYIKYVKKC